MVELTENQDDTALVLKKQRKRLLLWRFVTLGAVIAAVSTIWHPGHAVDRRDRIVRFEIRGVISDRVKAQVDLIRRAENDEHVKGLVLVMDTPGGGVTGGVALHDAVASFATHKPVVVSMQGMDASAGYMISAPATRIFAYPSTITGSIGVIMMRPDISGLLSRIGIEANTIESGPMKDQSQIVVPLKPEGRAMLQGVVNDLYDQFVTIVARGRHRSADDIRTLADGRPYTGRQAIPLHLVDELGDEERATGWMRNRLKVEKTFPVVTLKVESKTQHWWERLLQHTSGSWLGLPAAIQDVVAYQSLDGAVAILPR